MESVLRTAARLFRAGGFHGVSVDDLVAGTGLNRFALYEKFGGKEGLFYETLDFYQNVLIRQELLGPLFREDPPLDSLLALLHATKAIALDPDLRSGCLIVNANIELAGSDERVASAAAAVVASFHGASVNVLRAAYRRGDIQDPALVTERAEYVAVMIQAFFALAYIFRDAADQLILRLLHEVEDWLAARPAYMSLLQTR